VLLRDAGERPHHEENPLRVIRPAEMLVLHEARRGASSLHLGLSFLIPHSDPCCCTVYAGINVQEGRRKLGEAQRACESV
jgi:hypothetical protein